MQRQELIEFIMRLCKAWIVERYGVKKKCREHLVDFIQMYVKPVVDRSTILQIRNSIRNNARLNELLFDNQTALKELYDGAKIRGKGFTLQAAQNLFWEFPVIKEKMSLDQLE